MNQFNLIGKITSSHNAFISVEVDNDTSLEVFLPLSISREVNLQHGSLVAVKGHIEREKDLIYLVAEKVFVIE
jgi:hypothetical protein